MLVLLAAAAMIAIGAASPALAARAFNVAGLGQLELGPPQTVTDIAIDGDVAVVGRGPLGFSVVDISVPGEPALAAEFNLPGQLLVNDVQAANGRAYITNEGMNGVAVYIFDITDPHRPAALGAIIAPILNMAHNLFIDGDILYVAGNAGAWWRTYIFDVSDPSVPVLLAVLPTTGTHDLTVLDGILYEAGGWAGVHLWDVSDPAAPMHLAAADTNEGPLPHFQTHSVWPTEDRRFIVTMNELLNWPGPGQIQAGGVKVWSWDGGGHLQLEANWRPDVALGSELIAAHNIVVAGRFAYLSYYQAGFRVLDLEDPRTPVEVAWYDTYEPAPLGLFEGCWGVGLGGAGDSGAGPIAYASDRTGGLFELRFNGAKRVRFSGILLSTAPGSPPVDEALVRFVEADRRTLTGADGRFNILLGEGEQRIDITAAGYKPQSLTVHLLAASPPAPIVIKMEPLDGGAVAGGALAGSGAPGVVRLDLSRPNPFAGVTAIPFGVGAGAGPVTVRLTIHDATGRTVRVLAAGERAPGAYEVVWDGRDGEGRTLPAGVYYPRLVAGGVERRGRVELLK